MRTAGHNRPMSTVVFRVMAAIMKVRGGFRDKEGEVKRAGVQPGDVVLDFGCGLGFSTFPAADTVGREGKVYALDIHPLAIETVDRAVRKRGLGNVVTVCSGLPTGIPDDAVDVVLLFNVLPLIEDRAAVIRELHRVLKPGGALAVSSGRGSRLAGRAKLGPKGTQILLTANGQFHLNRELGKLQIYERL